MVRTLLDAGHAVMVVDDLSTGHRGSVPDSVPFIEGNIADASQMQGVFANARIDAVFHFAAKIRVEESVHSPREYYRGNLVASLRLLDVVLDAKVPYFVLSSTAAVYGNPDEVPIPEDHPKRPLNPYGETKLAVERALFGYGRAYGLKWAALRYFNAAGAYPEAGLGERHDPETHLLPIVLDVARGRRPSISVYGTQWPTADGTCVRDYIHVRDLCEAHLAAASYLASGGESGPFNLGTGQGHSVHEVIETARRVTGRTIAVTVAEPRSGDPAVLVANVERAKKVFGWQPKRTDLGSIVADAWAFLQQVERRKMCE
jgi:UDP-glucose 4-epimerase